MPTRIDGRSYDQLRPVTITPGYIEYPEGSVLIAMGKTKILCNVSIEESVPRWMQNQGVSGGWITGEYAMLPRSTLTRTPRESNGLGGRTQEIRRLIGRALRAAVDLNHIGTRTITVDCDVLQADGGTRTAAITGGYVALALALRKLHAAGIIPLEALRTPVVAVSVGITNSMALLDLCYSEDSQAAADFNVVMNDQGEFIETQGTAEHGSFSRRQLNELLDLAEKGIRELLEIQAKVLASS